MKNRFKTRFWVIVNVTEAISGNGPQYWAMCIQHKLQIYPEIRMTPGQQRWGGTSLSLSVKLLVILLPLFNKVYATTPCIRQCDQLPHVTSEMKTGVTGGASEITIKQSVFRSINWEQKDWVCVIWSLHHAILTKSSYCAWCANIFTNIRFHEVILS